MMLLGTLALSGLCAAASYDGPLMDLDELSASSERVIVGEVREVRSAAGGPGIETIVEIHVEETLLGTPAPVVSLRVPGGVLGDVELTIPGAPRFVTGQDVMVFLGEEDRVVGFGQGAFLVTEGLVWRDLSAAETPMFFPLEEARRTLR
ncbi:MAG: hypothetical protein ACI8S6_002328 [Myxococcota bacterium]|jgi:hypothetical protein